MRLRAAATLVTAATLALAAVPGAQGQTKETAQAFFAGLLQKDPGTTPVVKALLRTGAGFVSPRPTFADLTGDGKSDAVVTVENGGTAGVVALYVISSDGAKHGRLRVVFRSQRLWQGDSRVSGATLTVVTSEWSKGDAPCCATRLLERDYAWSARARKFTRRALREVAGPGAPPQQR
jgi:hypothetical protein